MRVISYYALTDGFRSAIEAAEGEEVEFTTVGALRNLSLVAAVKAIRSLRSERLAIAIENDDARPLAAPLSLVGALTGTKSMRVIWPDGRSEALSRRKVLALTWRLVWAQIQTRVAYGAMKSEARHFLAQPVVAPMPAVSEADAVLYLDANLAFGLAAGGSLGHIRGVIDAFVGRGHPVDYASVRAMPTDALGARWLKVPPPSLLGFPPELNYYSFAAEYERRVAGWANARRYAFIYQRMSLHNYSGARLRQRLGLPLVLEYNGSEAWAAANWAQRLQLHDMAVATEHVALRNADLVVTVSKVLAEEVARAGVPRNRIVTYPNCIDPAIFDPSRFPAADRTALRKQLGIAADARLATFIGTFGRWHGVDFLAHAIRRLIDEDCAWVERQNLHFLIVGDGLKMPEVRTLLDAPPYRKFVTLPGLVPQRAAPAHLAASDLFLSPHMPNEDGTPFFGSPTKLFEYMAMARPIVASDLDQIGLVLRGKYLNATPAPERPFAELFAPGDEDGFLRAVRKLVDDPVAAMELGERARQEALARYTWDHHVGAILGCLKELEIIR